MKLRKIIAVIGLAFIIASNSITAHAVDIVEVPAQEIDTVYNQSVQTNEIENWAEGPKIYSESGIVMDVHSGAVLYAKNVHDPHYPASITKVLTALVALENSELTDTVTIKQEDIEFLEYGDSHVGLRVDEQITMEDALQATLLASGNEAAHAVGSNIGDGYEAFLELMNAKVKELGGKNSNFANTHGLHDENHYTSAYDMALIGAQAIQNEDFRRITGTKQYTIPVTNITNETRTFQQNHKMLYDWRSQYYEYCIGGKTGYTDQALTTLVTFAEKDGITLVSVVMRTHGSGNSYVDTRAMLDYAFSSFSKVSVTDEMVSVKGLDSVAENSYVMIPSGIAFEDLDASVTMPKKIGVMEGTIEYSYEGISVGKVNFTITKEYHDKLHDIKEPEKEEQKKKGQPVGIIILKIILVIFLIGVISFLLLLCYAVHKRRERKRKRAEMRRKKRQQEYQRYLQEQEDEE